MAVRPSGANVLERMAPLSGVAFAVLVLVGIGLTGDLGFLDPPQDLAKVYVDDSGRILAGAQVLVLAAFLLVWFVGTLRTRIHSAEGGPARLASTAFGGGVAAAALLLAGAVAFAAAALRAEDAGAIDANAAATLTDFGNVLLAAAAPVALGIVTAATALASLRTGILPTWLGWISVALSVGLVILPINFMVVVLFLVWAVIVGILLYVQPGPTTASSSAWGQQSPEGPLP
jgi:hypothetical protein